jgi:hypothetical protein
VQDAACSTTACYGSVLAGMTFCLYITSDTAVAVACCSQCCAAMFCKCILEGWVGLCASAVHCVTVQSQHSCLFAWPVETDACLFFMAVACAVCVCSSHAVCHVQQQGAHDVCRLGASDSISQLVQICALMLSPVSVAVCCMGFMVWWYVFVLIFITLLLWLLLPVTAHCYSMG